MYITWCRNVQIMHELCKSNAEFMQKYDMAINGQKYMIVYQMKEMIMN
jgi:hypothetical protein